MADATLSLVIPVCNEEKIIRKNVAAISYYLSSLSLTNYEIILVDNGSLDETPKIIDDLSRKNRNIKAMHLPERGLGRAIKAGIQKSSYEEIMFYAIDLPFGLSIIGESIKEVEHGWDFVIGSKGHPKSVVKRPFSRRIYSKLYHIFLRILFGLKIKDTQGSFTGRKSILPETVKKIEEKGPWFQTKLVLELARNGAKIKEIPVNYTSEQRVSGMKLGDGLRSFGKMLAEFAHAGGSGNEKLILLSIILLSAILRLPYLARWPAGLSQDEASKGYQAYSVLKTARSYRGHFLPFYFDDFSRNLPSTAIIYTYSVVPSVALFGLNVFAVRFPAVIFGVLTVFVFYFLAKELFGNRSVAATASFFLAVSPWHILMSRVGLEPITLPFFFFLGWWLLTLATKGRSTKYLYFGAAAIAVSIYSYQTALIFIPFFALFHFLTHRKYYLDNKKQTLMAIFFGLIILFPIIFMYLTNFQGMTGHFHQLSGDLSRMRYSRVILYLANFINHLNPLILASVFPIPLLIFAAAEIIRQLKSKSLREKFVPVALFLALIPPSLVIRGLSPLPTRSIGMIGFLEMLAAISLYEYTKNKDARSKILTTATVLSLVAINSLVILGFVFPLGFTKILSLQEGFDKAMSYVNQVEKNYEKIVFTNKANQPFIYVLFYKIYPPEKFQQIPVERIYPSKKSSYEEVLGFDKYKFCSIRKCYEENARYLFIAREKEKPEKKSIVQIDNPDGTSFRIFSGEI